MACEVHPHAPPRRWQAWALVAAFALLELALVTGNLTALAQGEFRKTAQQGWQGFANGAPMRAIAEDLRTTPLAEWLGQRQRELGWLLLHDLGPRVREGCPGWLFLVDEFTLYPQGAYHAEQRRQLVTAVQRLLHQRGQRLILALVPDKSRIETDHLCDLRRPAALETRFTRWVAGLQADGIEVIPLDRPLLEVKTSLGAAFDRTDTHWSIEGARSAAYTLASRLTQMGLTPSPLHPLEHDYGPIQPRWWDLVHLAGLDGLPEGLRPAPDMRPSVRFLARPAAAQETEITADTLFGDASGTDIVLVGTSFSRNAYFADFLAEALKSDVANLALDGGGFAQAMVRYLETPPSPGRSTWVVWEIPERVLQEPLLEAEHHLRRALATGH